MSTEALDDQTYDFINGLDSIDKLGLNGIEAFHEFWKILSDQLVNHIDDMITDEKDCFVICIAGHFMYLNGVPYAQFYGPLSNLEVPIIEYLIIQAGETLKRERQ